MPWQTKEARRLLRERKNLTREELLELEDELWSSGIHELHGVACDLLCTRCDLLDASDLTHLQERIIQASGWAHGDNLSAKCVGPLMARLGLWESLDLWARHEVFWVRRASMLALLLPLHQGDLREWPRFARYAAAMIEEREFFIRKAIGWVLRETSKRNPQTVYEFLKTHSGRISGLSLREGGKHLPQEMRADLGLR